MTCHLFTPLKAAQIQAWSSSYHPKTHAPNQCAFIEDMSQRPIALHVMRHMVWYKGENACLGAGMAPLQAKAVAGRAACKQCKLCGNGRHLPDCLCSRPAGRVPVRSMAAAPV